MTFASDTVEMVKSGRFCVCDQTFLWRPVLAVYISFLSFTLSTITILQLGSKAIPSKYVVKISLCLDDYYPPAYTISHSFLLMSIWRELNVSLVIFPPSSSLSALSDGIRGNHRHPVDPVSGVVSAVRRPHTEPPHQHHLLRLWCLHSAASYLRHQVRKWRRGRSVSREMLIVWPQDLIPWDNHRPLWTWTVVCFNS